MAKKTEQEKLLAAIETQYTMACRKFTFDKSARNFKAIAKCFGITSASEIPLEFKDLQYIKELQLIRAKDKYESRRYITERAMVNGELHPTGNQDKAINSQASNQLEVFERTDAHEQEAHSTTQKSTWVAKYPTQKAVLMVKHCNQQRTAKELWDKFSLEGQVGQLIIAATGSGKTFLAGNFIKNFVEQGFIEKLGCISPYPIAYITANPIVEQTEKVFRHQFGLDVVTKVHVVNIECWRSKFGKNFVKETVVVKNGVEHVKYQWNQYMHPCLVFIDECQQVARDSSTQHRILISLTEIWELYEAPVIIVMMSATPLARICEGKVFACATRKKFTFGLQEITITPETWTTFTQTLCDDPYEYNTAAIKRFREFFDSNIRQIQGIKSKYKAFNSVCKLHFIDKYEAERYAKAIERFYEKKAKIEASDMSEGQMGMCILAQLTIFAKEAEDIKAPHYAKWIDETWKKGKAPVLIVNYKQTITHTVRILIEDYNWTRENISLIWGGSTETLSAKQKMAKKVKEAGLDEKFKELGIDPDDLGLDLDIDFKERTDEEYQWEKLNKLLTNDAEEERTNFQKQITRCCMMTFAKGGVGLSVHHEGDADYKPIYKDSRPREVMLGTIWSEKKLIQGCGRAPRITSCSHTYQTMGYYAGTIEEKIMWRVVQKMKCIREMNRTQEHWEDIVTGKKYVEEDNAIEIESLDGVEQEFVEEAA